MSQIEKGEQFEGTRSGEGHSVSNMVQPDGEGWMSPAVETGEKWQEKA